MQYLLRELSIAAKVPRCGLAPPALSLGMTLLAFTIFKRRLGEGIHQMTFVFPYLSNSCFLIVNMLYIAGLRACSQLGHHLVACSFVHYSCIRSAAKE